MAISVETKNGQLHIRDGEKLYRLNPESIGMQIKLTAQNGVEQADVQAELEAIHTKIEAVDAIARRTSWRGSVNSESEIPNAYEAGIASRQGSGNQNSDFTFAQYNLNGAVTGPASAADGNIVSFDQTTGKVVKDSGLKTADVQAAVEDSKKVWNKTAAAVPDSMPEDLHDGGLLIVDASFGG